MVESVGNINHINNENYDELMNKYIEKIEKRDNLLLKKQIYLDAKHINMSHDLMKKEINLKIEIKKLRIEKNLILSSFKLKKKLNHMAMEEIIKRETDILVDQIKGIDDLLVEANKYICSCDKESEYEEELSKLYKKMIIRISPIFNKMNKNKEKLWEKTELAYIYNDLNKLKMISTLTNDNNKYKIVYTEEELYSNIQVLEKEIRNMKMIFPFNIEDKIDKEEYKVNYRREFEERIEALEREQISLNEEMKFLRKRK